MNLTHIHRDLAAYRKPNQAIYFLDAGVSAIVGWGLFWSALSPFSPSLRLLAFGVSALALYRALAFIHELVHQREMSSFRTFWHVIAGIPLLLPLLLYLPIHRDHHNTRTYGTVKDGEYDDFKGRLGLMMAKLFAMNFVLPIALVVRFAILTPLSLVLPIVRRKVIPAFVHLSLRMPFIAPRLPDNVRNESRIYEWTCAAFAWLLIGACLAGHVKPVILWSALLVAIAALNTIRALISTHLYVERDSGRDLAGQVVDSINIEGRGLLTQLLCPVGLQYHALHHLAPQLPYHHLAAAHTHLMKTLPPDSPYRSRSVTNGREGWRMLVRATRK